MKKIVYFMLFLSVFILFSCEKEESEKTPKKCDPGFEYKENWDSCIDIDECKTDNGGCSGNCTNSIGRFECSCDEGFVLGTDDKTCIDIDECKIENGDCEQICNNNDGSFTCACNENFELNEDGKTCKDLNDCKEDSCNKHGDCIDGDDSFTCVCSDNYKGDTCNECIEGYDLLETECVKMDVLRWRNLSYEALLEPESIDIDKDDNIYVVGYTNYSAMDEDQTMIGGNDVFITKINSNLEIQWNNQFGTHEEDMKSNVAVDNNGNTYVAFKVIDVFTGTEKGAGSDVALVKLNSDGEILWKKQFVTETEDVPTDITSDSNNNIFIIGHRRMNKVFIKKLDENGIELDEKIVSIPNADYYNKVDIDENDNLYIVARTSNSVGGTTHIGFYDILVMKFDDDLNKVWYKEVGTETRDVPRSIVYKTGYLYISGNTNIPESSRWGDGAPYLVKLNKDGDLIFDKKYNGIKCDALGVAVSNEGTIFLTGTDLEETYFRKFLKKIDSSGNLIWENIGKGDLDVEQINLFTKMNSKDALIAVGLYFVMGADLILTRYIFK